ncbi:Phytochrome two-component sensor histidine kinase Cyanobacterial phytochrome B [Paramagnetospirillum magnetotacticum MS-1]|uniref:histidine kinase n=1 Tax=Paramagnetospirillum magnetotacticum MS-1 TaxID=272627 RepID=A0A0C2UBJ0_PARME|nr:PAS domain-containing protein [Paramagnetospirillum magnetotacticum]KIL98862.1 Phytochrome two-component sensor histidine kinase Cyanobacterial phytochrome B [Paramagnetospirillum magnetotacticum MS-1]
MRDRLETLERLVSEQSEKLRQRDEDLRTILDNIPAMIGYWDRDLRNRFGNRAYFDWFGVDPDKMPGMHIQDVIGEERYRLNLPYIERALRGERQTFEREIPTPDGRSLRHSLAQYIPDIHDGEVRGFFVLVSDITQVKETETHLRTVIDSEPECIKMVDALGKLIQMNPAGLAMIEAKSLDQVVGSPVLDMIAPEYRDAFRAMHQRVIQGESQELQFEILGLKGTRRWLETHAVPMNYQGERVHLAVTRDISAQKAMELVLKRSNAELEHFAYAASHDLRQPLRMISSYLHLLEKQMAGHLDEECQEFFAFAINGARRMDRMITDLLNYARVCAAGTAKTAVDLGAVLRQAMANLTDDLRLAELAVPPELPVVWGFESELERLFQNLIANAVKFVETGCRPKIAVTCRDGGNEWVIAISDNGIGIAPDDIERLFRVFQRLVNHDRFQGSGIGLASCRKIVEHHGGRIWVESQVGVGSTFLFSLPK